MHEGGMAHDTCKQRIRNDNSLWTEARHNDNMTQCGIASQQQVRQSICSTNHTLPTINGSPEALLAIMVACLQKKCLKHLLIQRAAQQQHITCQLQGNTQQHVHAPPAPQQLQTSFKSITS
jgi:hypothetical protein